MGTISGCRSYYALEDFGVRHYGAVSEKLGLTITRLPSDTTFRRILQKLDFETLAQQFEQWVNSAFTLEPGEWVAIDGKSIKGTVTLTRHGEPRTSFLWFQSIAINKEWCLLPNSLNSLKSSELKVVQTILESLQLEGVVFTMDALHCQKNY